LDVVFNVAMLQYLALLSIRSGPTNDFCYFSRRTPLNFWAAVFFLAGFFTAMNSPPFLLRLVQAVAPPRAS
jgi:hypothetical protein